MARLMHPTEVTAIEMAAVPRPPPAAAGALARAMCAIPGAIPAGLPTVTGAELPYRPAGRRRGGCPAFTRPREYLELREGGHFMVHLKRYFERRAIRRCLAGLEDIDSVADVPCGPGRLFPYWQQRGLVVTGVDCSAPMVAAADEWLRRARHPGKVVQGDAFRLRELLTHPTDLVASVRFCYYFGRDQRLELLRALATASRRYVLVQYKTCETRRGRACRQRTLRRHGADGKKYCTAAEIRAELEQAGLSHPQVVPIGVWSDRAFALGRKV